LLGLARAQVELGFVDDCKKTLERAESRGAPAARIEQIKAVGASWREGQAAAAAKRLEKMRRSAPRDVRLLVDLGTVWRRAGNAGASERAFLSAVQIDPDGVDARLGLAKLRLLAGGAGRASGARRGRRGGVSATSLSGQGKAGRGQDRSWPGLSAARCRARARPGAAGARGGGGDGSGGPGSAVLARPALSRDRRRSARSRCAG